MQRRLGSYILVERITNATTNEVWVGHANDKGKVSRPLAMKLYSVNEPLPSKTIHRLRGEAQILTRVRHPNIAVMFEFASFEGQPFSVSELVVGKNLQQVLPAMADNGDLWRLRTALYFAREIAAGLTFLHRYQDPESKGATQLTHGELHPGNVMISFHGEVKLIDIGLPLGRTSALRYSSPGHVLNQSCSVQDDIFSLGLIFWELCTGRAYWENFDDAAIPKLCENFVPRNVQELAPGLPAEVISIISSCLGGGYTSADELHSALQTAIKKLDLEILPNQLKDFFSVRFSEDVAISKMARKTGAEQAQKILFPSAGFQLGYQSPYPIRKVRLWKNFFINLPDRFQRLVFWLEAAILLVGFCTQPQVGKAVFSKPLQTLVYIHESAYYSLRGTYNQHGFSRAPSASTEGKAVTLNSEPPGAALTVDDGEANLVTPATLHISKPGMTMVRLQKPGYEDAWIFFSPSKNPPAVITLKKF